MRERMRVIEEIPASSSDSDSSDVDEEIIFSQHEIESASEDSSTEGEEKEDMKMDQKSKKAKRFSYFVRFFDDDLFQLIAEQTNLYSCQLIGASINTTVDELKSFVGMKLIMGVVRMPSMDDYWAEGTRYPKIADVMPIKRFKCLSRFIHFQDNETSDPAQDRLCKVTPVLEHIRKKCLEIDSENQFSIDEMMVPYKGTKAGSLRQYLPSKPHHWGIKQMADIAINNGWLLYRRDAKSLAVQKNKKLKTFRLEVADALIHGGNKEGKEEDVPTRRIQRPTTPRPVNDVRYDQVDHFPVFIDKGRCRFCPDGQTTISCQKCGVRLCIVTGKSPRNCFQKFHKK
ncbi:UNVERIFIED_CONTAM: hypothetical protein FKN15_029653 [Acipenser sinensis]